MKVLWIGVDIGPETKQLLINKGGQIRSAQVSNHNLLCGIRALDKNITTINGPMFESKIFHTVPEEIWADEISECNIQVAYKNINYLNRLTKEHAIKKKVVNWAIQNRTDDNVLVFIYSMQSAFLSAAKRLKKILPNLTIVLIVPDLPQYMDLSRNYFKQFLKKIDWLRIRSHMKYIDKYVLYTENMADYLNITKEKWILMEGSYDPNIIGEKSNNNFEKISVMYSGVLDLRYGIPELLDAMCYLDDSFELWLTGDGNARDLIVERAAKDKRIKYFGYLPSRRDLLDKQASATMLINPRRDNEISSKYCFPSKLFEYMVSGRPVLSCYLSGIPSEYHEYLVRLDTISAECIANAIKSVSVLSIDQQNEFGARAKEFVLTSKNMFYQANRVYKFALDNSEM